MEISTKHANYANFYISKEKYAIIYSRNQKQGKEVKLMYNYEKSIMELCQNDFQRRTLEDFCKAINHSDADLFVVMAHKAALLYQVLFEQGFLSKTSTEKIFVTNHSLDYNQ